MSNTPDLPITCPTAIEEEIWHSIPLRHTGGLVRNKAFVFRDCVDWPEWYRDPDPCNPDDWESKLLAGCRGEWFSHAVEGAQRVLDIGCGFGFPSFYLAREGYDVVGIDASSSEIETANAIAHRMGNPDNIRFEIIEPHRLPFTDNSFDAATMSTSLECVGDPEALLAELHRVLRPESPVAIEEEDRSMETPAHPVWEKLRWTCFDEAVWLLYETRIHDPYLDRRYLLRLDRSHPVALSILDDMTALTTQDHGLSVLDVDESLDKGLSAVVDGEWGEARGYVPSTLHTLLTSCGFIDIRFQLQPDGAAFARSLQKDGLLDRMPGEIRGILRALIRSTPTTDIPVSCMVQCRVPG